MPGSTSWLASTTVHAEARTYQAIIDEAKALAAVFFGVDDDDERLKNDPFAATKVGFSDLYEADVVIYLEAPKATIGQPTFTPLPPHGGVAMGRFAPTRELVRDGDDEFPDEGDDELDE